MKFGYIRVSCADKQEFYRQEFILKPYNLDKIFEEKISGTKRAVNRAEFEKMLMQLSKGDEVYFESMSRMARSMQDLIDTTNMLVKQKGVKVVFLKENLTIGGVNNNDAMATLIFNIMGSFAQFERDLIADRTKQGIKARRELLGDAFKIGKPKKFNDEQRQTVVDLYLQGKKMQEIAQETGISVATISRIINKKGE